MESQYSSKSKLLNCTHFQWSKNKYGTVCIRIIFFLVKKNVWTTNYAETRNVSFFHSIKTFAENISVRVLYIYIVSPRVSRDHFSIFLNPKFEPGTSVWVDMEWPEYNKSKVSYLSTPVVSPCKTLCQLTGRYSTLPIMLESSLCLKWLFMRLSEAFRNSLTAAENEKNKMRKTMSEYFFIENGTIKCTIKHVFSFR